MEKENDFIEQHDGITYAVSEKKDGATGVLTRLMG